MENVFFLIIDAFCYDNLNRKIGDEYTTPFLRSLMKNNLSATNMYSQAPYTEASYISLLSGENTLDNGGYLFGNNSTSSTNFSKLKTKGYRIVSQYAPYVYSKAYLRDVDIYYYTRLISIKILFDYRLYFYKDKFFKEGLSNLEFEACIDLLNEEFESWILQANALIDNKKECCLIQDWVNLNNIAEVLEELNLEYLKFKNNKKAYLIKLFKDYDNCNLLKLDRKYNERIHLNNCDYLLAKFNKLFIDDQKIYSKIIKKKGPDIKYLVDTLFSYKDGFKKFKGLVHNYMRYYANDFLGEYLNVTNEYAKNEVCMKKQFDYVIDLTKTINQEGDSAYVYLHVQDFHLPSTIHSVDYNNLDYQVEELNEALDLFKCIDSNYEGNILADLSARFCDNKIKEFYNNLEQNFGSNFTLVVTADHGFPSFFNPPRSIIYNQTFSEAFHVPFVVTNTEPHQINSFTSTMDFYDLIVNSKPKKKREYILSEYGGPGCPSIVDKNIWYTYIDKKYRVSIEVSMYENVEYKHITGIFDRELDEKEKKNLVKFKKNDKNIKKIITIINDRNKELFKLYSGDKFLRKFLES